MGLVRSMLLDEIVKAINKYDYDFEAQLGRDGRIYVSYTESNGTFNSQVHSFCLKEENVKQIGGSYE